jgi:uncharacterized protein
MHIYLPIADLSVNALVIVLLGAAVGLLSGMFGLGGGFLTTPFLIFFGIPPAVAAASAATQLTGASVSGLRAHMRRGGVDFKMGWYLVAGGTVGSLLGAYFFQILQRAGQIDTIVNILYVIMLLSMGGAMTKGALDTLLAERRGEPLPVRKRRHHPLVAGLPGRTRFSASGIYISPLAPLILGLITGIATALLGIGGGFLLIPAKVYLFGMRTQVVAGTSLFQILFVTAAATVTNAVTNHSVDIVLAGLLLIGSVISAQFGSMFAQRANPTFMRLGLGVIILAVGLRLAAGLTYHPGEIFSVQAG